MKKRIMALFLLGVLCIATACSSKSESNSTEATAQTEDNTEENVGSNENSEGTESRASVLKGSAAEEYFGKICTLGEMNVITSKEPDKDLQGNVTYTYHGDGTDYSKEGKPGNRVIVLSDANDDITYIQLNTYLEREDLLRAVFSELNFEGKDDAFTEAADQYVTDIVSDGKSVDGKNVTIGNTMCQVVLNEDEEQSLVLFLFATAD